MKYQMLFSNFKNMKFTQSSFKANQQQANVFSTEKLLFGCERQTDNLHLFLYGWA